MFRICASLRVNEQDGQTKRNMMQPHVPTDKVPHKEHHDGNHSEIPVSREGQAHANGSNTKDSRPYHEWSPRYPEKKKVWVSTVFGWWQDIQLPDKLKDMRMKISRKGCDVSRENISGLWTGWSKPPQVYWMLPWEQYAVRRRSPRSNKFPKDGKIAMVPWATKSRGRDLF